MMLRVMLSVVRLRAVRLSVIRLSVAEAQRMIYFISLKTKGPNFMTELKIPLMPFL
jgi:hypothetical protein